MSARSSTPAHQITDQAGRPLNPGSPAVWEPLQIQSGLCAPIVASDRVLGTLLLEDHEREHAFGEAEVPLLGSMAASMGVALENARYFDEAEPRAREAAALAQVGRDLSSSLDPAVVLESIATHARVLLNASTSALFLSQAAEGEVAAALRALVAKGVDAAAIQGAVVRHGEDLLGGVFASGEPALSNDTAAFPRSMRLAGTGTHEGERLLAVALRAGERVLGAMAVWRVGGEPFTRADLEILAGLASEAVVALLDARHFDETQCLQKETGQRNAELAIINGIQQGISGSLNFQAIVDLVGAKLREVFETGDLMITWRDDATSMRHILYTYEHGVRSFPAPVPDPLQRRSTRPCCSAGRCS